MYDKLKGIMKEFGVTQPELSKLLGMAISTLNSKLNGKSDFTIQEGKMLCELFGKSLDELFFTDEIHKMQTRNTA